jgi:hypothetical protein
LRGNGRRISEFQPSATGGNVANATVQNMRPPAWEYYASRRRNTRASDASPFNQKTGPVKLTLFVHNSADQVSSQQDSRPHENNAERIVGRNFEHSSRSY